MMKKYGCNYLSMRNVVPFSSNSHVESVTTSSLLSQMNSRPISLPLASVTVIGIIPLLTPEAVPSTCVKRIMLIDTLPSSLIVRVS